MPQVLLQSTTCAPPNPVKISPRVGELLALFQHATRVLSCTSHTVHSVTDESSGTAGVGPPCPRLDPGVLSAIAAALRTASPVLDPRSSRAQFVGCDVFLLCQVIGECVLGAAPAPQHAGLRILLLCLASR